jgi:hypothetical protein
MTDFEFDNDFYIYMKKKYMNDLIVSDGVYSCKSINDWEIKIEERSRDQVVTLMLPMKLGDFNMSKTLYSVAEWKNYLLNEGKEDIKSSRIQKIDDLIETINEYRSHIIDNIIDERN